MEILIVGVILIFVFNYVGFFSFNKFVEDNNMLLIGHFHYEEFMQYHIATQGNFMRALESLSIVGLDRIDRNPEKIAEKYGIDSALAEQIIRLYVTHPGVTTDGIMTKMGL